jgi:hypothetical protein
MVKGMNRFGYKETPDEVIEDAMSELEDVREMWSGSGKARGGRDGWLLDMKNFPNRFLPALTPVEAAIALGIQDDEEMMEKAATWIQASLGELPDLDSESLGIPDHLLKKLEHLIDPPACTACPFHTVIQEIHYCGTETCFDRKTRAWTYERMRAASKDLKIQIYDAEADGEFRVLEETWSDNGKKHMELFKKRGKDLRIALAVDIDRKKPQSGYAGVPTGAVVMVVGKTLKESLENGQKERAEKRSKEQAANLLQSLRTVKRELIEWEVAGHLKTIFDGLNMEALKALWDTPRYSSDWNVGRQSLPEGVRQPSSEEHLSVKEDFFRQLFAMNMVRKIGGHWNKTTSEYTSHLGETVKSWNVKLPKSVSRLASRMDEEITAVTAETE